MLPEPVWSNGIVNLNIDQEMPTLSLTIPKQWHEATKEEILSLEMTNAKMASLIDAVTGVPDHASWSDLNCNCVEITYILGKANRKAPSCNDLARKVALMQYTLQNHPFDFLKLGDIAEEIRIKAPEIFETPLECPATELRKYGWKNIPQALQLLQFNVIDEHLWEPIGDADEGPIDSACKVFCNSSIIAKQHIASTKHYHVLTNSTPYVDLHVMVVPKECRRTPAEYTSEEIEEKNLILQRIASIFQYRFKAPMVGVMTRLGTLAGQTQPHLHHHVMGYDPNKPQFWVTNWTRELLNQETDKQPLIEANFRIQLILPPLFKAIKVIVFDMGGVVVDQLNKDVEWVEELCKPASYHEALAPLTRGEIDEDLFWSQKALEYGFTYDEEFRLKWKECYLNSNPKREKVVDYINNLKSRGFQLALLSNTIASHYMFNQERGLIDIFDFVITSHQVRVMKPNLEIYEEVKKRTGLESSNHLFIDDVEKYVDAGHEAGFHAIDGKDADRMIANIEKLLYSNLPI